MYVAAPRERGGTRPKDGSPQMGLFQQPARRAGPRIRVQSMTVLSLGECVLGWESASAEATEAMGAALGRLLSPGDVVALFGELGSGKTVFVRGLARGLGCDPAEVHSPTFTLIHEYGGMPRGGRTARLVHVDLYRIRSEDEVPGIGWDAYMNSRDVVAVEWAERAGGLLPGDHLRVWLEVADADCRRLRGQATGPRSLAILCEWVAAAGVAVQAA